MEILVSGPLVRRGLHASILSHDDAAIIIFALGLIAQIALPP
jgi:hypothetical protein